MKESICSQRGSVNSFLLSALASGDKYAYEIGKAVKEISNGKYVLKEASLYSGLKRLEAQGFLTSYKADLENGLTRRYYSLTEEGKEKLATLDFSWESEQKGTFLKTFNNISTSNTEHGNEKIILEQENLENNSLIDINAPYNTKNNDNDNNSITISDEDDNLTKHYIYDNQQDLFSILDDNCNNNLETTHPAIKSDEITNIELPKHENTFENVSDFEFLNLKQNLKNSESSFLDKVNNDMIKSFNYKTPNTTASHYPEVSQENLNTNLVDPEENLIKETNINDSENNEIKKLDINNIFGDLYINNLSSGTSETSRTSEINQENIEKNTNTLPSKNNIFNNENNINCTLQIPTKESVLENIKTENENCINDANNSKDLLDEKETSTEINKNLNDLLNTKTPAKKTNITMNNSVLYANQKIDHEKPSFETMFQNKINDTYEIRYYKPIENKIIKSTFYNCNKINMFASISSLLINFALIFIVYFFIDKTPIKNFSTLQLVIYVLSIALPTTLTLYKSIIYFTDKYKIVKQFDFKTNIFFKTLFGMCIISTLFIIYKFFELNIEANYSYLIIVPLSVFVCLVLEEIFKFFISKFVKN